MTGWVRLWHDMPTDPKWRVIARKSGQPLSCVIALFTLMMTTASAADDRGDISSLSIEDAAAALDIDEAAVAAITNAMEGRVIEGKRLTGWDRRQPKRERENDNSSQRVKEYRERSKNGAGAGVTPCNATKRHETPREDKIREDKINPPTPHEGELPDWVPADDWAAFAEMRKSIKKPMTPRARSLLFGKLEGLAKDGHSVGAVLQQSTVNCWQDVFPIKRQRANNLETMPTC